MNKMAKRTLVLAMALGMSLSAASCGGGKASSLIPKTEGGYGFSVANFTVLDSSNTYTVVSSNDGYAVFRTGVNQYTYYLVNIQTGTLLGTSSEQFYRIDRGFYCTSNDEEETLEVYHDGQCTSYDIGDVEIQGNILYNKKDNTRMYVNFTGGTSTVRPNFEKNLSYGDTYLVMGEKYVKPVVTDDDDVGLLEIYNGQGVYEKTVSLMLEFGVAEDEEGVASWVIDDTFFVQTMRQVPDEEKDYDFSEDGDKYELTTYTYNVGKGKAGTLDDFNYLVEAAYAVSEDMALAYVQKVENQKISMATFVQMLDKKGNVAVDIQNLVPNAADYDFRGEYVYIIDVANDVHVFKKNDKIATVTDDFDLLNGYAYQVNYTARTLQLFNLNDNYAFTEVKNVSECREMGDNLVYFVHDAEAEEKAIVVYNTLTGSIIKKTLDFTQSVSMNSMYVTITNADGTKDLYFPETNETKSGFDSVSQVYTFSYENKSCLLIRTQIGEKGEYYMITKSQPVVVGVMD